MAHTQLTRKPAKGICVVGVGNWGTSLVAAIGRAGLPLREVVVRGWPLSGQVSVDIAAYDAEIVWLCVPDAAIEEAARRVVERRGNLRGQVVVHSSGALTSQALEAARRAGAEVASAAPVMSFPSRKPVDLGGVLFAVEGAERSRRRVAGIVRKLGGLPFPIKAESKVLYHAAATLASPLLVSALHAAVLTARAAGLSGGQANAMIGALAQASAANYFANGPEKSFSGPFARGDVETIELHLRALAEHPMVERIYLALAENCVGSLPVRNRRALSRVLRQGRSYVRD